MDTLKGNIKEIDGINLFLMFVMICYFSVFILANSLALNAISLFIELLLRILPLLVLVLFFIFISNLLISDKRLKKYLGTEAGIKGWFVAIVSGIISSGPIYMWLPFVSDLKEKGVRVSYLGTFLYNKAIKVPLIPMMAYYFGFKFVIVLTIYMIIFSVLNGIILEKIVNIIGQYENSNRIK